MRVRVWMCVEGGEGEAVMVTKTIREGGYPREEEGGGGPHCFTHYHYHLLLLLFSPFFSSHFILFRSGSFLFVFSGLIWPGLVYRFFPLPPFFCLPSLSLLFLPRPACCVWWLSASESLSQ